MHPGVGRAAVGVAHVCDDAGLELTADEFGTVYFERDELPFKYHRAKGKTVAAQHMQSVNPFAQPAPGVAGTPELTEFLRQRIAHFRGPRSFEFIATLPRTPTGNLGKAVLGHAQPLPSIAAIESAPR